MFCSTCTINLFVDQLLCIEVLAKHIPADHLLYVREHPSQFYSHTEGHTSRLVEFYDDLLAYPQVRFMPLDIDPFLLITKASAVATVTGTSGWEAMALGKPVINFGLSWYEKYAGVLKIVDEKSASQITKFIEKYKFNERDLLAYLNAFSSVSVNAYAHPGYKEKMKQDEAQCVANLARSVMQTAAT
jgi:capsule polysaccharide export protein KpsC/LpsZ